MASEHASGCVTHRNRSGDTYYLHEGRTAKGNPKYFFSRKAEAAYRGPVPSGFEVYENPNAIVSLRRCLVSRIAAAELELVQRETRRLAAPSAYALVELKKDAIEVHAANGGGDLTSDLSDWGRRFVARSAIEALAAKHRSYHPCSASP